MSTMKRSRLIICLLAAVVSIFVVGKTPAHALASTSFHLYCDGFTMSGTTGSQFIQMWVQNSDTGVFLIDDYNYSPAPSQVFESSGGNFNITVHFPQQPQGTNLAFDVWGAASA